MIQAGLFRLFDDDQGTIGMFSVPELGWSCYVNELPDRDNRTNLSRIPADDYIVKIRKSPKYGWIFYLTNVQGRSYILIHAGNLAGDILKGWKTDSAGCILTGRKVGFLYVTVNGEKKKQRAVLNSRTTLNELMSIMDNRTFKLKVA